MHLFPARALERAMKIREVIARAMSRKINWIQAAEILGMSDRVIVMRQGRIVDRFNRPGLTAERLAAAATGNVAEVAA